MSNRKRGRGNPKGRPNDATPVTVILTPDYRRTIQRIHDPEYGAPTRTARRPCARCLVPRRPEELGRDGKCLAILKCDKEFKELLKIGPLDVATEQVVGGLGVASRRSMPHNGGGTATGVVEAKEKGMSPTYSQEVSEAQRQIDRAYELLARGDHITDIQKATRLSDATLQKMRDDKSYKPNPVRIVAQRVGAQKREEKRKAAGRPNGVPVPKGESRRDAILRILREPNHPETTLGITKEVAQRLDQAVGGHEVQHILFALRQQGLVSAKEQRVGSNQTLYDVKLTTQGWRTTGGVPPARPAREPFAPAAPPSVAPAPARTAPPAPEEPKVAAQPTPAPLAQASGGFPLIKALLSRGHKVRAAARLLEEAGLQHAADLIRNEEPAYTDLEAEVIKLVEEHNIDI